VRRAIPLRSAARGAVDVAERGARLGQPSPPVPLVVVAGEVRLELRGGLLPLLRLE
jgi:hypothetical protein